MSFNLVTWTKWHDSGEKYRVPFDEVCFKKVIQLEERCTVFLQPYHWIWCIRETGRIIEICLGSKPVAHTYFLLHFPFGVIWKETYYQICFRMYREVGFWSVNRYFFHHWTEQQWTLQYGQGQWSLCSNNNHFYGEQCNDWRRTPGTDATHTQCSDENSDVDAAQFLVFTRDADSWRLSRTYLKIWVGCAAGEPRRMSEGLFSESMEYFLITAVGKIDKSDNRWWHKCVFF